MRCKCIKTYVPSITENSYQFYYIAEHLTHVGYDGGYVVNGKFILSKEVFNEYFVDCAQVRDELLEQLGI